MKKTTLIFLVLLMATSQTYAQKIQIALLKYSGGGDWYANPTALPNLVRFCNQNMETDLSNDIATVEAGTTDLFNYPLLHMTGHGNVIFNPTEAENLRSYLIAGGFLHISDNYGMDEYVRREMNKVFPGIEFVELPFTHPIYNQKYKFPNGLPKIHEHDDNDPQGFGIIYEGRLVCFYDYECDLGDGWEESGVHDDSEEKRREALQMGANIIQFVFEQ